MNPINNDYWVVLSRLPLAGMAYHRVSPPTRPCSRSSCNRFWASFSMIAASAGKQLMVRFSASLEMTRQSHRAAVLIVAVRRPAAITREMAAISPNTAPSVRVATRLRPRLHTKIAS